MAETTFYLGETIDPKTGKRTGDRVEYPSDHLVTHGVIVGMTGSGKTGLGTIYLEEALRKGIPTLILDPKGDMTNLLLTFPDLAPANFEPWVDPGGTGKDRAAVAAEAARSLQEGLRDWGLSGVDIAALRKTVGMTVYTPGSTVGVPLDVLGALSAPKSKGGTDPEAMRDEIEGLASGILALVGVASDPVSGREHILLANILEQAWTAGQDFDLESLIARVHRPPMRKLGVFEIDTFFPEKDRLALAMRLNTLLASPSFQAWRSGPPLDPAALLWRDGKPQAAVLYLAHLSDDERQFVVTMVLSRLITWMRSQPGTDELRALVYMDEVFGFVPPTAMPPAKKPILTLLKTARAFGIGLLLTTQNPVDLDYKAMSNAGTWCIGRLQTERDKARILEALQSASGATDLKGIDALVSGLGKRQFVLHDTRASKPIVFATRWAMSYLRGPLTRDQVARLVGDDPRRKEGPAPVRSDTPDDATPVAPDTASSVPARHVDPGATWLTAVGANPTSTRFAAALAARVQLSFDDAAAGVSHREEWEAVFHPLTHPFRPDSGIAVDHDPRDFRDAAPTGATYLLPEAPVDTKSWFTEVEVALRDYLVSQRRVTVSRNRALKLYSRVGEDEAAFVTRCRAAADGAADAELVAVERRFQSRIDRIRDAIDGAYLDVREAQLDAETRHQEEVVSGASTILGVLMGRRNSRSISGAASKRSMTRRAEQRVVSAETKAAAKVENLEALEADLADAVTAVTSEWQAKAEAVDTIEIGLEKTDVTVEPPVLVWVPV